MAYFIISKKGKEEIRRITRRAINQSSINNKDVKTIHISVPSNMDDQTLIVRALNEKYQTVMILKHQSIIQLSTIAQLPQSLLNEVFGKYEIPESV